MFHDIYDNGEALIRYRHQVCFNDIEAFADYLENGVSEYDVYDRIERGLPLFAAKLWGKGEMNLEEAKATSDSLGDAPGTNFGYEVESKEDAI